MIGRRKEISHSLQRGTEVTEQEMNAGEARMKETMM